MAEMKISRCPQGKGSNRSALINLRFVISVPAHPVVSMTVQIEQASVEVGLTGFIHLLKQWPEPVRPADARMNGTAVAIPNSLVGKKHRQPWDWMTFAIDLNNGLLPQELLFKLFLPALCQIWLQLPFVQRPVTFSCGWVDGHS